MKLKLLLNILFRVARTGADTAITWGVLRLAVHWQRTLSRLQKWAMQAIMHRCYSLFSFCTAQSPTYWMSYAHNIKHHFFSIYKTNSVCTYVIIFSAKSIQETQRIAFCAVLKATSKIVSNARGDLSVGSNGDCSHSLNLLKINESRIGTQPRHVGTQPRRVGTQPRHVETQPRHVGTQPRRVGTQPWHVGA